MEKRDLWNGIRENSLIKTLTDLKGNPRVLVFIEPLWGIPYNLIAPFTTIYMRALGVGYIQIGILLSVSMLVQVFSASFAGIITDKLGRKKTTQFGDFFGWVIPCLIWAFAQNFWFFLAAMTLNSFEQVNQTSWHCLMVEDAEKKDTLHIYTWVTIAGLAAVFFAPISGALIPVFSSVVPIMRVLYFIFAVAMLAKNLITWRFTKETQRGRIRMEETRSVSVRKMISEYGSLIPRIFRNREMVSTLGITVILLITGMINGNFFALFVSEDLQIPENFLAYFPIFRAAVMLLFMFALQHKLAALKMQIPMCAGFVFYIAAQLILITGPVKSPLFILFVTLLEAVAIALVGPRKDSMLILFIDEAERARIMSFMCAIGIAFTTPFGYLAGFLFSLNRCFPFLLSACLYSLAFFIILRFRETSEKSSD